MPVFPPDTSVYDALKDMKERGVSLALVGDVKSKTGLLIMDEVIRRML
jgi:CBS domain-containing protein